MAADAPVVGPASRPQEMLPLPDRVDVERLGGDVKQASRRSREYGEAVMICGFGAAIEAEEAEYRRSVG